MRAGPDNRLTVNEKVIFYEKLCKSDEDKCYRLFSLNVRPLFLFTSGPEHIPKKPQLYIALTLT